MTQPLHPITMDRIDPDAAKVVRRLNGHGFEAYLVGGCVRDMLLGHTPKDFDVATNATPDEIKGIFRNCRIIGRRFRLAHIYFGRKIIETATFRTTPQAPDNDENGRDLLIWRDNEFGTAEQDAERRDFTINGLFYDVHSGQVIDSVGGMHDLRERRVRTIGDPDVRFQEDPVRILRAVKFAARLSLEIDGQTRAAMIRHRSLIAECSIARVLEEIYRLLRSGSTRAAFGQMQELGLLPVLFPEIAVVLPAPPTAEIQAPVSAVRGGRRSARGSAQRSAEQAQPQTGAVAETPSSDPAGASDGAPNGSATTAGDTLDPDVGRIEEEPPGPETPSHDEQELAERLLADIELDTRERRERAAVLIWAHLDALDRLVQQSEKPPSEPVLLGTLLGALLHTALRDDRKMKYTVDHVDSAVNALGVRLHVSRRHRDRLKHILVAQRRLLRPRARPKLATRDYFADACQLLRLRYEATGTPSTRLPDWTAAQPSGGRRRRRRRRLPRPLDRTQAGTQNQGPKLKEEPWHH